MIATISPRQAAHIGRHQAKILYRNPTTRRIGPTELVMGLVATPLWTSRTQTIANCFAFAFAQEWLRLETPVCDQ